ncbi:MAG: hypothetical protein HZB13_06720 [Acidobacteria bacterium]|nr:hypothetical protein [Acidobacteriota bacterium]
MESWKEIAAFFNVTVRTAQIWETERGLPVRRGPGEKGRVYAYPQELRDWRDGTRAETQAAAADSVRRWPWVVLGALLLLAVLAAWWIWSRPADPVTYNIDGPRLITYDARGREVWRRQFASEPARPWSRGGYPEPAFLDIDGDGRKEFLFPFKYAAKPERSDILYCFTPNGDIRWTFSTSRTILTGGNTFDSAFGLEFVTLVPVAEKQESRVLVGSLQEEDAPFRVALLDSSGRLLREYWHSGRIRNPLVTDFDGDGKPEIYLSGFSAGFKMAALVALDPENFEGASREDNPEYQILAMPPPRELARVLFPRSSENLALRPHNLGGEITHAGHLLTVVVHEAEFSKSGSAIFYEFERGLKLTRVEVGDSNVASYKRLHTQGVLKSGLTQAEIDSYRNIRFLTPWAK